MRLYTVDDNGIRYRVLATNANEALDRWLEGFGYSQLPVADWTSGLRVDLACPASTASSPARPRRRRRMTASVIAA